MRPEIGRMLSGWAPHGAELTLIALFWFAGGRLLWMAVVREGWVLGFVALAFLAVGSGLAFALRQKHRFGLAADGRGVVEITEARIAYFSADGGAFLDRDALTSVDLITRETGSYWILRQDSGPDVAIPHAAAGAGELQDLFAGLSGFDMETALRRLEHKPARGGLLWRLESEPTGLTQIRK
ncbi:hypothetical protein GO499_12505 [Algicella marina]|uniref:Uncharacterized protein n=1 Tax=Algicella marina TaxID=2683284 RepID=A0A6P1T5U8_9RHOB|nr:hypothetical protein GO499_12505 [Algicella marina]